MAFSNHSILGLGVFPSYQDAEVALEKLRCSGFSANQLSFLAKASDRHDNLSTVSLDDQYVGSMPSASNPLPEPSTSNSPTEDMACGLTGLVAYPDKLILAGTGPVVAGGRLSSMVSASNSFDSFKGSLGEVLKDLGIPEQSAVLFRDRVNRGDCLIGVEGSGSDILKAEEILHQCQINHWQIYEILATDALSAEVTADFQGNGTPQSTPIPGTVLTAHTAAPAFTSASSPASPSVTQPRHPQIAVGVFRHYAETELALRDLQRAGFSMEHVSVITRNGDRTRLPDAIKPTDVIEHRREHPDTIASADLRDGDHPQVGKGATTGALAGASVGGLTGLLVGLGTLAIPGIGPILLAGTAATAIATTLAGGAIRPAAGGFVGALVGLGIPEDRAKVYQARLAEGNYLVAVTGIDSEIRRAERILNARGIEEWGIYPTSHAAARRAPDLGYDNAWNAQDTLPVADYPMDRRVF